MPLSPPSVRPVLAALLTALLVASSVLVSGPATLLPAASAAATPGAGLSPSAPPPVPENARVSMDLVSLTPTSLAPGGTVQAQVEVTNTSSEPLTDLSLELRTRVARVTERDLLAQWQADTSPDTTGAVIESSAEQEQLAPGESITLTVEASAEELGYAEESYYWGTRRLSLTVVADEEPLSALRSFVVWRPEGAGDSITQSVLLPVAAPDPAAMVTDPAAFADSASSGRLASLQQLAVREDVDWWLDPSLLDPPQLALPAPEVTDEEATEGAETVDPILQYEADAPSASLASTLQDSVGDRTVVALPYAQSDVPSLQQAGTSTLERAVQDQSTQVWEDSGIMPRASALPVDGASADADALESVLASGATSAIVPASSLREDPTSDVTPSSVGVFESEETEGTLLPLLAPDPTLSEEFSLLTADSDTEQTQQRLLAETATIASEYTTASRHLLIAPSPDASLDAGAASDALDALAEAPWVETGSTSTLLGAADRQSWTTDPQNGDGELYALGRIGPQQVLPSAPDAEGRWVHGDPDAPASDPDLLDPEVLSALESTWDRLDALASVMEDGSSLDAPRREILAGTSMRWRQNPEGAAVLARDSAARAEEMEGSIQVLPASGYNVISDTAGVPITITNDLDTPIRVRAEVTSDKSLVQVEAPAVVEVPAHSEVDAMVDVEAIANGTVTLTTVLTTEDGRPLTAPVDVPLTVNPSWENWTTLVLVIAMGVLVIVGVARARRTGSSARGPAVRGPEDPVELAQSGRSTLDTGDAAGIWAARAEASGASDRKDPDDDPETPETPEEDRR